KTNPRGGTRRKPPLDRRGLGQPRGETRAQMFQRFSHLRFDGLDGNAERLRDLGVAKPLLTAEPKYFATCRRQLRHRGGNRVSQLARDEPRRTRGRNALFANQMWLGAFLNVGVPNLIERAIARRTNQIRAQRFLDRDGRATAP